MLGPILHQQGAPRTRLTLTDSGPNAQGFIRSSQKLHFLPLSTPRVKLLEFPDGDECLRAPNRVPPTFPGASWLHGREVRLVARCWCPALAQKVRVSLVFLVT